MDIAGSETWRTAFHQEAPNAILSTRPNNGQVCNATVSDPHLRAIEYMGVAITTCCGAHARRVAAEIRLRQAKAPNHLSPCHAWQPTLLLLLRAKRGDREHGKR